MGNTNWGVDSLTPINATGYSGCGQSNKDLGWYAIDCYYKPDSIRFWGRYFVNFYTPADQFRSGEPLALIQAVGGAYCWVLPICTPDQSKLSGSLTQGQQAGNAFCNNLAYALNTEPSLHLPGTNELHCFLDVEPYVQLSQDFWDGWAEAVDGYSYNGTYPFYPCCYLNPTASTGPHNCSILTGGVVCYGVWASEPDNGTCDMWCQSPGPTWQAYGCPGLTTVVWQYGINSCGPPGCGCCWGGTPVDLDLTNPNVSGHYGYGECDSMLFCH